MDIWQTPYPCYVHNLHMVYEWSLSMIAIFVYILIRPYACGKKLILVDIHKWSSDFPPKNLHISTFIAMLATVGKNKDYAAQQSHHLSKAKLKMESLMSIAILILLKNLALI